MARFGTGINASLGAINYTPYMQGSMAGNDGPEYKDGKPTRLLLSLKAWGASSKADAKAKAKAISDRNKAKAGSR